MAPIQSTKMDNCIATATLDPWHVLPSLVFGAVRSTDDEPVYLNSSGYTHRPEPHCSLEELANARKMKPTDVHDLWSASKLIAVIAALQLVESGQVDLHADASQYVPELKTLKRLTGFKEGGEPILVDNDVPVTVHMMITHTAGFVYETVPDYEKCMKFLGLVPPYDKAATREAVTGMPCLFVPGSGWQYGPNNDWLTLVVENVSGLRLNDYEQKFIFHPLGIDDISYSQEPSRRVGMSYHATEGNQRLGYSATGSTFPTTHEWGGTGLFGSPKSYLKVLQMLLRGGLAPDGQTRLLKEETVDAMFSPQLAKDSMRDQLGAIGSRVDPFTRKNDGKLFPGFDWGLGGVLSGEGYPSGRSKHSLSWSGYANTFWVVDRERDVAFVCWTQVIFERTQALFNAWELLETELYKEIAKQ